MDSESENPAYEDFNEPANEPMDQEPDNYEDPGQPDFRPSGRNISGQSLQQKRDEDMLFKDHNRNDDQNDQG